MVQLIIGCDTHERWNGCQWTRCRCSSIRLGKLMLGSQRPSGFIRWKTEARNTLVSHDERYVHHPDLTLASPPVARGTRCPHNTQALITPPICALLPSPPPVSQPAPLPAPAVSPPSPFSAASAGRSRAWAHRRRQVLPCVVFVSLAVPRVVFRVSCPVCGAS